MKKIKRKRGKKKTSLRKLRFSKAEVISILKDSISSMTKRMKSK